VLAAGAARRLLREAVVATRARDVYGPLALTDHVDHRIVHEAMIAAMADEAGRNALLFEERPEACRSE